MCATVPKHVMRVCAVSEGKDSLILELSTR
jgi:hypothetical protein